MPICALSKFCRGAFIAIVLAALPMLFAVATNANPLAVDPHVFSGQLENGMRYAVMPNDGPANTASVRLYLGVGSLHETDHERGYAHFVEHMAFNGSEAFAEGELVKALQSAGLAFGAHANASTGFERTIYSLDLPNVENETIDLALKALRETASNLLFTEEAIERERGVLTSELEARNGKGLQVFRGRLKFMAPTSRANERFAAGTKAAINKATRDELLTFYRDFYRPENAFLVFVGDIEVDQVDGKIRQLFSDWHSETPRRDLAYMQERLVPETTPAEYEVFSLDGINSSLLMTVAGPFEDMPDSLERRELLIKRSMANAILAQRLDKITRQENASILSARVGYSRLFKDAMMSSFSVSTSDESLFDAAALIEQEMRRVMAYGFTDDEVDEQKANFNLSFQHQADAADKRVNTQLANAIVSAFQNDTSFIHPEDQLEIYKSLESELAVNDLNSVFADMWRGQARFFATTGTKIENGPELLESAVSASSHVAVEPPKQRTITEFAYHDFGEPGEVVWREENEDLGFTMVRFANNLKVNLKPTEWEDNTVRMTLRLGGGIASLPEDASGIHNLINVGFINGGLGKHEVTDIPRLMAGRTAAARLQSTNSAYVMSAGVVPGDMLLQFELWAAYLTDPAFRDKAYGQYVRAIESYFQSFKSSPRGVFSAQIGEHLYSNERFILPTLDQLKDYSMADLRSVFSDMVSSGALELTIVGDFEVDAALKALKPTLGALSDRNPSPYYDPAVQAIKFPKEKKRVTYRHEGGFDQAQLTMYWPTVGRDDHQLNAELLLAKDLLQVMITESLREEAGLAYTPSVSKFSSHLFNDYGFIAISTDIGPHEIEQAEKIFKQTVKKIVHGDFDNDQLERARRPRIERLRNARKNNRNWLSTLQLAQSFPDYITYNAGLEERVASVSRTQIIDVAEKFLSIDPRLVVRVVHEGAVLPASEASR